MSATPAKRPVPVDPSSGQPTAPPPKRPVSATAAGERDGDGDGDGDGDARMRDGSPLRESLRAMPALEQLAGSRWTEQYHAGMRDLDEWTASREASEQVRGAVTASVVRELCGKAFDAIHRQPGPARGAEARAWWIGDEVVVVTLATAHGGGATRWRAQASKSLEVQPRGTTAVALRLLTREVLVLGFTSRGARDTFVARFRGGLAAAGGGADDPMGE